MYSNSQRKMMSLGERAQWMKAISVSGSRSPRSRVIDIIGVMPEPAEMNRYFSAGLVT